MLKLSNISKTFNQNLAPEDLKIALKDINLQIEAGEFVTIIGSNGSGKTTLFNIINGSIKPDCGSVFIDQNDVTNLKEYQRAEYIGIVFQDPLVGTAAGMSILENLLLANMRARRKTFKWGFKTQLNEAFKKELSKLNLGLETRLNQKIGLLSGGQRQALTLLMATLKTPQLLLLDEHTAALDPKTADTVLKITEKIIKEHNLTTIMITHNMRDALLYGNRLIMLCEGEIVLDIKGEEKKKMSLERLIHLFYEKNLNVYS
ncbi:MAG: ATP-binding cassette domain-containing protein [Acholeplasmataceae bacterium]|jgi:putative ABC transport system ATP-binding protein|nr:ATP-binding cassette domain-containing protein [Acholeplasmataceae bacterium]